MPPQQAGCLLDFSDGAFGFGAHGSISGAPIWSEQPAL
jgi:hypothetical protein